MISSVRLPPVGFGLINSQAPAVNAQRPAGNKPAPVASKPAPVVSKPAPVVNKPAPAVSDRPWKFPWHVGPEVVTFHAAKDVTPGKPPVYRVSIEGFGSTQELRSDKPPKGRDPAKWAEGIRRIFEARHLTAPQVAKILGPVVDDLAALKKGEIEQEDFDQTFAGLIPKR